MDFNAAIRVLILTLIPALGYAQPANVISRSALLDGTEYQFPLSDSELEKSPAWKDSEPVPPLDPRKASVIAKNFLEKLTESKKIKWELSSITLQKVSVSPERWLYKVGFNQDVGAQPWIGFIQTFEVIVYLDGNIVDPVVSNSKSR